MEYLEAAGVHLSGSDLEGWEGQEVSGNGAGTVSC